MANKQINELTEKTTIADNDLLVLYDMSEGGSEKTKKIAYSALPSLNIYETVLSTATDTISVGFDHNDSGVPYVDGVRQMSDAYTFSGAQDVVFDETLVSGTKVAFECWC